MQRKRNCVQKCPYKVLNVSKNEHIYTILRKVHDIHNLGGTKKVYLK